MITEEFLSYIWQYRLASNSFKSTSGEVVEVLHPGFLNTDSGPDFVNARVRINGTLWAGNVEIHVNASDWRNHKHHTDAAYQTVILHVVYNSDVEVPAGGSLAMPTIELAGQFNPVLLQRFEQFQSVRGWIPCAYELRNTDPFLIDSWLNSLVFERYAAKTAIITNELSRCCGDWELTFYIFLARAFGSSLNAQPFELLARSLPHTIIARHKDDLFQLEALLFGQAGMLHAEFEDDYPVLLQKEYFFLRKKWALEPLPAHTWKFHRLRPAGFPTIRIAQFASLLNSKSALLSTITGCSGASDLYAFFNTPISEYWNTHYNFDAPGARTKHAMSRSFTDILILNAVVTFLFALGKVKDDIRFTDRALQLLEEIPAEGNSIVRKFDELGVTAVSALQSQALLHLKNEYCDKKRCLECRIGHAMLTHSE